MSADPPPSVRAVPTGRTPERPLRGAPESV